MVKVNSSTFEPNHTGTAGILPAPETRSLECTPAFLAFLTYLTFLTALRPS